VTPAGAAGHRRLPDSGGVISKTTVCIATSLLKVTVMAPPQGPVVPVGQEVIGTSVALAAGSTEAISRLEVVVVLEPDAHPESRIALAAKQNSNHRVTFICRSHCPFATCRLDGDLESPVWKSPGQVLPNIHRCVPLIFRYDFLIFAAWHGNQ